MGCVKAPTQEQGQSLPAHTEADCLQKEIFLGKVVFGLSEYLAHRFKSISLQSRYINIVLLEAFSRPVLEKKLGVVLDMLVCEYQG